jgi:PAS domain S-box-containing protein
MSLLSVGPDERVRHLAGTRSQFLDAAEEISMAEFQSRVPRQFGPEARAMIQAARRGSPLPPAYWDLDESSTENWVEVLARAEADSEHVLLCIRRAPQYADFRMARAERDRLTNILAGPDLGTWEWNVQTGETRFNERWAEIVGYTLADLEPISIETWLHLSHPEDLAESNRLLEAHWRGESEMYECECRMRHRDGRWVWVHDRGRVIERADDGAPLYMAGTHQEITALKEAEGEREILQRQLLRAQKLESIGQLSGGIAHDFNNMLAVIVGHAEFIAAALGKHHPEWSSVEAILQATRKATAMTRQLLAFSRQLPARPQILDLADQIDSNLRLFQSLLGAGVSLTVELAPERPRVCMDPGQLSQVFSNLLLNARDAVEERGEVTVRVGIRDGLAVLEVSDSGPGVAPEHQEHVFDPFFTTKEPGRGSGLGLPTAYGIVKKCGGELQLESPPGRGATFRVLLPRAEGAVSNASVGPQKGAGKFERRRIFVVEDEPMLLALACEMLRSAAPDILLTDVLMPGLTGPELARALEARWPGLRTIYMSAHAGGQHASPGLDWDAELVSKPFTRDELLHRLLGEASEP